MVSIRKDSSGKTFFVFGQHELFAFSILLVSLVIVGLAIKAGNDNYPNFANSSTSQNLTIGVQNGIDGLDTVLAVVPNQENITATLSPVDFVFIYSSKCTDCSNTTSLLLESIKQNSESLGIIPHAEKLLESSSPEAQNLISKFNISKLPAFLIYGNLSSGNPLLATWNDFGTVENGVLVLRSIYPPYVDSQSGQKFGLVNMVELVDKSCVSCYNVSFHEVALKANFGMVFSNISVVDRSSVLGKSLISKYNITILPTVLLSNDSAVYFNFDQVWKGVGSIENDGVYIFRKVLALKNIPGNVSYMNISSGKIELLDKSVVQ